MNKRILLRFKLHFITLFVFLLSHICLSSNLIELEKKLDKNPTQISIRKSIAKMYFNKKNYDKVVTTLDPYSSDLNTESLFILAEAYKQKLDYKNESRILTLALKSEPENYKLHINLAKSLAQQELYNEATESYRKAIQIKPQVEMAYLGLLSMFKKRENNYESQLIVNDLIKRFGRKPQYLNELCRIFTEEAYLDQAIATCKEASEKSPKEDDNIANLVQCYLDSENNEEAEKNLKQAVFKFSKSLRIHLMAASFYFDQNNFSVANRHFLTASKIDNNSHNALLGLARTFYLISNYKESLYYYEKACHVDSKNTLRYFKEATTKLRLDKVHEWESRFNSALFRCNK